MPTSDDTESLVIGIEMRRVFVPRIWLGMLLLHVSLWLMGGRAEVLVSE